MGDTDENPIRVPASDHTTPVMGAMVPGIIGFLGMTLTIWSAIPLRDHTGISLGLGMLVSAAVVVGIMTLLGVRGSAFLGLITRGTFLPMTLGFFTMAFILGPLTLLKQEVAIVPAWWVLGVGIGCLIASTVIHLRQGVRHGPDTPPSWVRLTLAIGYPSLALILGATAWIFM